jgi:hypothetical protein
MVRIGDQPFDGFTEPDRAADEEDRTMFPAQ